MRCVLQVVANQEAHVRRVTDVVPEIRHGHLPHINSRRPFSNIWIGEICRREGTPSAGFDQAASIVGERVTLVSRGDVADDGNARALEPKTVAFVSKILERELT